MVSASPQDKVKHGASQKGRSLWQVVFLEVMNNMQQFLLDIDVFKRRSFLRFFRDLGLLILATYSHYKGVFDIPNWISLGVPILLSIYVLFELVSFPSTYNRVRNMRLVLTDNSVRTSDGKFSNEIHFSDLESVDFKKKDEKVLAIKLITKGNQSIDLAVYKNMNLLLKLLQDAVAKGSNEPK